MQAKYGYIQKLAMTISRLDVYHVWVEYAGHVDDFEIRVKPKGSKDTYLFDYGYNYGRRTEKDLDRIISKLKEFLKDSIHELRYIREKKDWIQWIWVKRIRVIPC